jgi:hypothetical protein
MQDSHPTPESASHFFTLDQTADQMGQTGLMFLMFTEFLQIQAYEQAT